MGFSHAEQQVYKEAFGTFKKSPGITVQCEEEKQAWGVQDKVAVDFETGVRISTNEVLE